MTNVSPVTAREHVQTEAEDEARVLVQVALGTDPPWRSGQVQAKSRIPAAPPIATRSSSLNLHLSPIGHHLVAWRRQRAPTAQLGQGGWPSSGPGPSGRSG